MKAWLPPATILALACAFTLCPLRLRAEPPSTIAADLAWFGTLGFPDVKGRKFIRYTLAWPDRRDYDNDLDWEKAFLLEEKPDSLRVLSTMFEKLVLQREYPEVKVVIRHEPADFRAFAEAEWKRLNSDERNGRRRYRGETREPGLEFSPRRREFVMAWLCDRQGLPDLAERFYSAAVSHASDASNALPGEENWSFRDRMNRDLGNFAFWRILLDLGNPAVPRPELLARLRALPARFPHCDHLPRIAKVTAHLASLVAEDEAHQKIPDDQIPSLPPEKQVAEWIYRLRDEHGEDITLGDPYAPPRLEYFNISKKNHPILTPGDHLVLLGDTAVLPLIDTMFDPRPIRRIHRRGAASQEPEYDTIGTIAKQALEHIAGRKFFPWQKSDAVKTTAEWEALVRAEVRDWWVEHQARRK